MKQSTTRLKFAWLASVSGKCHIELDKLPDLNKTKGKRCLVCISTLLSTVRPGSQQEDRATRRADHRSPCFIIALTRSVRADISCYDMYDLYDVYDLRHDAGDGMRAICLQGLHK